MIIRSLSLVDWMKLTYQKATSLQEYVVGPEAWNCNMALRKAVVGQLIPLGGHWHHWIALEDQQLMGLVIARDRSSPRVWQVSHLLLSDEAVEKLTPALFHEMTGTAILHRAEKLFMRLPSDSPITHIALDNQFEPYLVERLYQQSEPRDSILDYSDSPGTWRAKTKQHNWAIFQLYSSVVPAAIRQAEGLSFAEWLQARERKNGSIEKVLEKDGLIMGWSRARPWCDGSLFEFIINPGDEGAVFSLMKALVRGRQQIYCLTQSYQTQIQELLESEGFNLMAEHSVLLKRLLVRVTQTRLAPIRA